MVESPDGTWGGTIDSIDQGVMGIPIRNLVFEQGVVRFGNFEGTVNADASEISGRLKQDGTAVVVVFHKVAKMEAPTCPQVPRKPLSVSRGRGRVLQPASRSAD